MRRLLGQVHSFDAARALNILPGSKSVNKNEIPNDSRQVVLGLILLCGCFPVHHVNPGAHHFGHAGTFTLTHCILSILWMMGFERMNLFFKTLIRTGLRVGTHLANAVSINLAAAYLKLFKDGIKYDVKTAPHHTCFLSQPMSFVALTRRELGDLRMLGCDVHDELCVNVFAKASILNVHFKAGQWGAHPTCSSVFTCLINGRSVYGHVRRFLSVDGDNCPGCVSPPPVHAHVYLCAIHIPPPLKHRYASVSWFGPPTYPLGHNRLEVVVSRDGSALDREIQSCVIRITQIDPSYIVVEPDGDNLRMMRQSGYDTVP